ncbi:FAD:protein FMN transferase [Veronia pacifica]|uniref:FAD:protein FMN transferase n=1 Tax=Veronia pacifica TaxID=1080227 RepID=A0A1C3EF89_9GAMM|nr:FAD:protein FMN transferase [Veronia pacifica]ODA31905.1 FAD:protein FMN transferase ApbE [Veronia pacifica]
MKKIFLHIGLVIGLMLSVAGCDKAPELVHLKGSTMGTYYSVKFTDEGNLPDAKAIQAEIDKRLELVNDQMSTYRKNSELSRFNQSRDSKPFEVSADTAKVITEALRINKLTEGSLDITVGPLVNLWGFGPEGRPDRVPSAEQIAERRAIVGIEHLSVDGNKLEKDIPELYVDLSSIAKGYGVDVVANYLASIGAQNYLVEIGGELQLKGLNQEGKPWKIAIEKPTAGLQSVQEIIAPGDMAMATSGSYRNYFEENGVRYSHTIDPKTANPIKHRLVSVTVLDKSCMTADGLSTGFMVLGAEKARELANKENIPAFFIVKTDEGFDEIASDAFAKYLSK